MLYPLSYRRIWRLQQLHTVGNSSVGDCIRTTKECLVTCFRGKRVCYSTTLGIVRGCRVSVSEATTLECFYVLCLLYDIDSLSLCWKRLSTSLRFLIVGIPYSSRVA